MSYRGSSGWLLSTSQSARLRLLITQVAETRSLKSLPSNYPLSKAHWKFYRVLLKYNHRFLNLPLVISISRFELGSLLLARVHAQNKWLLWSQLLLKKSLPLRTRNTVLPSQTFKLGSILKVCPTPVERLKAHRKLIASSDIPLSYLWHDLIDLFQSAAFKTRIQV